MGSSHPSRLTPLQRDLLERFFEKETRFFLTGGGALGGYYLGHRDTEDLDLFTVPGVRLEEGSAALEAVAADCAARVEHLRTYPTFRRCLVSRGEERCVVDLVVDAAPMVDPAKVLFGRVRVDTLKEIAANKICALLSRSEIKDLVDLQALLAAGIELPNALADAEKKDATAEPATLAWVLDQMSIGPDAPLPGGGDAGVLDAFRKGLVKLLRTEAFGRASSSRRPGGGV